MRSNACGTAVLYMLALTTRYFSTLHQSRHALLRCVMRTKLNSTERSNENANGLTDIADHFIFSFPT